MKILKDISLSLFHLEREYMDSYFLENKNTERRLKALNRWYAFLGYKIRFDTEPFQVPIFNATLNDLYTPLFLLLLMELSTYFLLLYYI